MILLYTGNDEGWYYFFENKEVYDELAAGVAYIRPSPAMQLLLSEKLKRAPEQFDIQQAKAGEYFKFRFCCQEEPTPESYLPYRILYYHWDDEGYFYMVKPDFFQEKTNPETGVAAEREFETIPLAQQKELLDELATSPDKFIVIEGSAHDFFYRKFRIKSM